VLRVESQPSYQALQISPAIDNADDVYGLDLTLIRVGLRFIQDEVWFLDKNSCRGPNFGPSLSHTRVSREVFNFRFDGQKDSFGCAWIVETDKFVNFKKISRACAVQRSLATNGTPLGVFAETLAGF
jgi:hypothetical protein